MLNRQESEVDVAFTNNREHLQPSVSCDGVRHPYGLDDGVDAKRSAIASFITLAGAAKCMPSTCSPESAIDKRVLYTVGQLNGKNSVGRLDQLQVKNVETIETPTGCIITYEAELPVAWGHRSQVPEGYALLLPRDVSREGIDTFVDTYTSRCLDWGAHDVDAGVFGIIIDPRSRTVTG